MNSALHAAGSVCTRPKGPVAHPIQEHCWRLHVPTLSQLVTAAKTPTAPKLTAFRAPAAGLDQVSPSHTGIRHLHPQGHTQETSRRQNIICGKWHKTGAANVEKGHVGAHRRRKPFKARAALQVLGWGREAQVPPA